MIELTNLQQGSNQYAVYDLAAQPHPIDNVSVMMINSNQNREIGLVKISFEELNGEKQRILFDVTGMMSLSEYLRRNQTQSSFRDMILAIVQSIETFDEYMIGTEQVLLHPDHVYINYIAKQVKFLCLPFTDAAAEGENNLYDFFSMICNLSFSNVELRAGEISYFNLVLNAMSSKTAFSLKNIRQVLAPETVNQPAQPAAAAAIEESAAQPQSAQANETGDVVFTPQAAAFAQQQAAPMPMPAQNGKASGKAAKAAAKEAAKAAKAAGKQSETPQDAAVPMIEMPTDDSKEDKSLIGKFRKKLFNKGDKEKDDLPAGGGLAGFAAGSKKEKSKGKGKKDDQIPPVPQFTAPVPMPQPAAPAPAPEFNHTIFVPSGSSANAAPAGGLNARANQAQIDLFAEPAGNIPAAQFAQPQGFAQNNILGGGMSGMQPNGLPPMQTPPAPVAQAAPAPAPAPAPVAPMQPMQPDNDPKTVVIVPDATVRMENAFLLRKRDGSRIMLEKPMLRVGRNRDDIDINLPENLHIGHMHATLLRIGSGYVVIDNNSANHTYLNHTRLDSQNQYPLKDGDKLAFADEEFEYHIGQ